MVQANEVGELAKRLEYHFFTYFFKIKSIIQHIYK